MAILAVFIPVLMLGVVLALGRYEDFLLPGDQDPVNVEPAGTRPISSRGAAGTPAPSP
ncbi:hypothetical protein AB0M97_01520 [Streptomyces sp. NPDC051207]|uniref:hypothetical protein n=1 Tax=Streptomyces sp. NPDC051207 TaxID=3154641 RepID=UPI00343319B1